MNPALCLLLTLLLSGTNTVTTKPWKKSSHAEEISEDANNQGLGSQ